MRRLPRILPLAALLAALLTSSVTADPAPATGATPGWSWPRVAPRVVAPYLQPPHRYGPGHRGLDVAGEGDAVTAPADGVVAFAGTVVDRGVLTLDHGDGWVSSFEPVVSDLHPGEPVRRGQVVATVQTGGHAPPGTLHLGARLHGEYVNPLLLLGGVPRAVLLPCC